MEYNKKFFEKVFSNKRMERYFALYPDDEKKAIKHYQSNIKLAEAFYTSLSVLEVALRNALSRELETMTGREDWYAVFPNTPGLNNLNRYITQASKQIVGRHEAITPLSFRHNYSTFSNSLNSTCCPKSFQQTAYSPLLFMRTTDANSCGVSCTKNG